MVKEPQTASKRDLYISPETGIIILNLENKVMTSSGEDAGDEETPGF